MSLDPGAVNVGSNPDAPTAISASMRSQDGTRLASGYLGSVPTRGSLSGGEYDRLLAVLGVRAVLATNSSLSDLRTAVANGFAAHRSSLQSAASNSSVAAAIAAAAPDLSGYATSSAVAANYVSNAALNSALANYATSAAVTAAINAATAVATYSGATLTLSGGNDLAVSGTGLTASNGAAVLANYAGGAASATYTFVTAGPGSYYFVGEKPVDLEVTVTVRALITGEDVVLFQQDVPAANDAFSGVFEYRNAGSPTGVQIEVELQDPFDAVSGNIVLTLKRNYAFAS